MSCFSRSSAIPNLAPEISSEYDGGFTTTFGEWGSFTSTYFSRRVHNLIVTVPVPVSHGESIWFRGG